MIPKEKLTPSNNYTNAELCESHLKLYDIAETARTINTSDDWLDLEDLEEVILKLKAEFNQIQQDISAIKLQLQTKKDRDPVWEEKANKALSYKTRLQSRYQQTLSERNTELKQLRRQISTNHIITIARDIMEPHQWEEFTERLSEKTFVME